MKSLACAYCARKGVPLHRDHVVPRSRGGPDNASNIVMACPQCNHAKRDKLPSEWLGDECPARIRRIEDVVNKKLANDFAKRDKPHKKPATLYAFHLRRDGYVDYVGEIVSETDTMIRLESVDALMFTGCGLWCLSGGLYDLPKAECRIFNDKQSCAMTAYRINEPLHRRTR